MRATDGQFSDHGFAVLTGAAHAALFLLGALVGMFGCFYFAETVVGVPIGTVLGIGANFVMCWLGGLGMRSKLGAALPAAGWLVVAMAFAAGRPEGDIVVTSTGLGLTFLFGGTVAAGVGIGAAPSAWLRQRGFR
ncbi:MAG: hypothetical protein GEV03_20150 [Streptosporangiales bacterium]|nr:hypothetical protein [Streptosporangiales bacterium]